MTASPSTRAHFSRGAEEIGADLPNFERRNEDAIGAGRETAREFCFAQREGQAP
jgi:hypothetical protein